MFSLTSSHQYFLYRVPTDMRKSFDGLTGIVQSKFRGIDPLIKTGNRCIRLTDKDPKLAQEYHKVKQKVQQGWPVTLQ